MKHHPRIVAVDDKADNLLVIAALLKNLIPDVEVYEARTGQECLDLAESKKPDVILLDIIMPGMDGFEVCRRLKSGPATKYIPVIMLTAMATDASYRIKGLETGADAFLTKPIDESELVAQVKVALRIKHAEDQLRSEKSLLEELVAERTLEVRESEEGFRRMIENSPMGIAIMREGRIIYQNPEHERLAGPLQDAFKFTYFQTVHPEDVSRVKDFYEKIHSGEPLNEDIDFRFVANTPRNVDERNVKWVICRATRVRYQQQPAVLFYLMDITRTRELEQLVSIEDKMSSLGRVAAGIAHEIRNPLSSIYIYINLLRRSIGKVKDFDPGLSSGMNENIEELNIAAHRIDSVIKRVMDFSRPGKPDLKKTDINRCVEAAVRLAESTVRKMDIVLEVDPDPRLAPILLEEQALIQVMMNLIINAAEAMDGQAASKRIKISTTRIDNQTMVSVADSGPGIPLGLRKKIFDPFYTTKETGSGIGLSICQRIVTDLGGSIDVFTSPWGGAEFNIRFADKRP